MKFLIIAMLGAILATSIEFIPNRSLVDSRDVIVKEHLVKLEPYGAVELKEYDIKPVYCADYVRQYDWNKEVAHNVMMVESRNIARNLNDNPNTGDYSVGCFQVNLLGANQTAKYRLAVQLGYTGANERYELREWLWNPENNVRLAYTMWKGQGWSPWSFTTCKKVACY